MYFIYNDVNHHTSLSKCLLLLLSHWLRSRWQTLLRLSGHRQKKCFSKWFYPPRKHLGLTEMLVSGFIQLDWERNSNMSVSFAHFCPHLISFAHFVRHKMCYHLFVYLMHPEGLSERFWSNSWYSWTVTLWPVRRGSLGSKLSRL